MRIPSMSNPRSKQFLLRFFWLISTLMLLFGFVMILLYWNG